MWKYKRKRHETFLIFRLSTEQSETGARAIPPKERQLTQLFFSPLNQVLTAFIFFSCFLIVRYSKLSFLTGQADENTRKSPLVAGVGKLFTSQ